MHHNVNAWLYYPVSCDLSLITIHISDYRQFSDICTLQGSVATYFGYGGIFKYDLLQIYHWVWRWKYFENRSTFMGKSSVSCFLTHVVVETAEQTVNRWRTVVSATWKYDDPRLNMSHEGAARVWHVQPRVVIFPCHTNYRLSYVLSSDQLQESWIICKLKSF